ncbi:hypothetical protein R5R35_003987 [Gryllus longicercus]|uniref:Zinc finger MYND domain-containing protein 11 n=1 Tax=Gryllus longicercus TaxID=2509291 RepID=A0AAN9Z7P0_9ORTH
MQMNVLTLRLSCPVTARYIWKAIDVIHRQRQIANFQRIRGYLGREYGIGEDKLREQLHYCVRDGLLVIKRESKKNKKNVDQEGYVFPSICDKGTHDWYCFECHFPGEVLCCSSCFRVFHIKCIAMIDKKSTGTTNEFMCHLCCSNVNSLILSVERLNCLLGYEFKELKKRLPLSASQWQRNEPKMLIQHLIYNPMDLDMILKKICSTAYNNIVQFRVDIQTFFHNLVYAQVKGYPFWPAKVIEKINDQYDVRFFGCYHQRALVEKDRIIPINESIDKFQKLPKSISWQKACRELKLHQLLLKSDIREVHEIIRSESKKRKTRKVVYNEKRNGIVLGAMDLKKINKYALKACLPFKREINSKRKKINMVSQRRRKDQNDDGGKKENSRKNIINSNKKNDSETCKTSERQKNVQIQTTCFSMHGHRKYISNLENKKSLEFGEVNYDCNEIVTRIINSYNQNQTGSESKLESHAFCNVNCPLNQCRRNIVSDFEIEKEIKKATLEATNIINCKYGEIVDKMAQSYMKMMHKVQKKIWCTVCLGEATLHCCWGVDYCSQKCRDEHWESEHSVVHMQVV